MNLDPTVLVALIGVLTTIGSVLVTGWLSRRRDHAQVEQITAAAHAQIFEAYRELLDEQRLRLAVVLEESRETRHRAGRAEQRAAEAELAAEAAGDRSREAVRLLAELRPLIHAHVPGADTWLARVDQVVASSV